MARGVLRAIGLASAMLVVPVSGAQALAQAGHPRPAAGARAAPPVVAIPDKAHDMPEFFGVLDRNGDGTVTQAEFDAYFADASAQASAAGTSGEDAEAGLATYFALMDANGDGRITRAEFDSFNTRISAQDGSGD